MSNTFEPVSFRDEPLILVDEDDTIVGHEPKEACHLGQGRLHRAFSVFLFNDAGELLLQRRADGKHLWPGFWSNSCCSHPRKGESRDEAASRRTREELGLDTSLEHLYTFTYHAQFGDIGAEHEVCAVYVGLGHGSVVVHPDEISEWKWVLPDDLDTALDDTPGQFTPWFKMEWAHLKAHYPEHVYRGAPKARAS